MCTGSSGLTGHGQPIIERFASTRVERRVGVASTTLNWGRLMVLNELGMLRWVHILAMVYWLGGEWGVFQTSYNVVNRKLPMEERRRHMETAYRIDILARSGIILLLPLGLHMGTFWGVQPFGGKWLVLFWILGLAWLALCWSAFIFRRSDTGLTLQSTITVTRNEILYGLNQADKFILAIVVVDGNKHEGPFYVRQPFTQEPDWAETSKNLDLGQLLAKAVAPEASL